jgi:diguanylate cyclase (GGDEF)-like protein
MKEIVVLVAGMGEKMAALDSLLRIPNREQYDQDFEHSCGQATAEHPLSLAVIDLDQFKSINDTYGHETGDEVLRMVATAIVSAVDGSGSCYRYGGEEIAVLMPGQDIRAAMIIAERVRSAIGLVTFEKCPERMAASIGVTSYPETTTAADEVFFDADAMMYKAKDDGGNAVRSVVSSGMTEESARFMRIEIASRLEGVTLWMRLQHGHGTNFSAVITNDSDEDVTIEAITLRKERLFLSEPSKPGQQDDWKIPRHTKRQISWTAQSPPVARLRDKEPLHKNRVMEVDIVVWARVLGRLRTFSHTILVLPSYANLSITEWG